MNLRQFLFMFFLVGCVGTAPGKKQTSEKTIQNTTVTGIKHGCCYDHREMTRYKDSLDKYVPFTTDMTTLVDSFVIVPGSPYGFIRYDHDTSSKTGLIYYDTTRFLRYLPTSRDSLKYMPDKILNFELQGIFMNSEKEDGDDIDRFGFYVDPKTNDVLQITHMFYVGNPIDIYVYTHNKINPFKGNEAFVKNLLRLDKPLDTVNHIRVDFHMTNGRIDSSKVTEY